MTVEPVNPGTPANSFPSLFSSLPPFFLLLFLYPLSHFFPFVLFSRWRLAVLSRLPSNSWAKAGFLSQPSTLCGMRHCVLLESWLLSHVSPLQPCISYTLSVALASYTENLNKRKNTNCNSLRYASVSLRGKNKTCSVQILTESHLLA